MGTPGQAPYWRRSRGCGTSACVEVAKDGDLILVRDSKNPQAAPLAFTSEEWRRFTAGVVAGDFDTDGW